MPAVSERQRRFMGAELSRARSGKRTKTGMSAAKLKEFASKPTNMRGAPPAGGFRHLGRFQTGIPRKEYPRP